MVWLVRMLAGIVMGIEQVFQLAPAHANRNLIGSILLFLFGLYCRLIPAAATSTQVRVQAWRRMAGAIIFSLGVALAVLKEVPSFKLAPIAGLLLVRAAMALSTAVVFRSSRA